MMELQIITKLLSILTIITQVLILCFLLTTLFNKLFKKNLFFNVVEFAKKRAMLLSLLVALCATSGSLFFSEILFYEPCKLCWFQRIFMYPLVILFLIAYVKKDKRVFRYAIPLSMIGGLISLYHYITSSILKFSTTSVCSVTGVSCFIEYIKDFNYVTIPMMALTAFVTIIIFGYISKMKYNILE